MSQLARATAEVGGRANLIVWDASEQIEERT
jgi:hypothetical protein